MTRRNLSGHQGSGPHSPGRNLSRWLRTILVPSVILCGTLLLAEDPPKPAPVPPAPKADAAPPAAPAQPKTPPPAPAPSKPEAPKPAPAAEKPAPAPATVEPMPKPAAAAAATSETPLTQKQIYQLALKSSCMVALFNNEGKLQGHGSGWVLDKDRKLVVTNSHVVEGFMTAKIFFPEYEGKRLITESEHYLKSGNGIAGTVLLDDPRKDLAVLKLDRIPDSVVQATLAEESPSPGDFLHSIGNPGASDALWVYTTGTVRQVYRRQLERSGGKTDMAMVIETQSPVNPGDSGGPVVNDQCKVVGVVSRYRVDARLVTVFIDITEVMTVKKNVNDFFDPKTVDHYLQRGIQFKARGDFEKALADFSAALKLNPNHALCITHRGEAFAKRGDKDSALADYDEAIRIDPLCLQAYLSRADIYIDRGKWDPMIQDMTKVIRAEPGNHLAYFYRSLAHAEMKNYESAINDATLAVKNNPQNYIYVRVRGNFYRNLGKLDQAVNDYVDAIKLQPRDPQSYIILGETLLFNKRDPQTAVKVFSQALETDPNNALALVQRARAYYIMDQLELSLTDLNKAEKLSPNNPSVYDFRGDIYLARREYTAALADYQKAVQLNDRNPVYLADVGITLAEMSRNAEALDYLNRSINLDPKYARAYVRRAVVLFKLGDKQRSEEDAQTAKSLDPTNYSNVNIGTRYTRFIRVTNTTNEPVKVFLLYKTKTVEDTWAWFPSKPEENGDYLIFEIPSKRTLFLARDGVRIHAAAIRIWGRGVDTNAQFNTHRYADLLIAPVAGYITAEPQNFDYTFRD